MLTNKIIPLIEKGEGKPLIFLHGFMCSKEYFASQINYFSRYFKVIAYDLYGFGENLPKDGAYDLSNYANEFYQVASAYGNRVNVVAHSFGCRVILKSALEYDIIDKAVLCGVAGLKPAFSVKKFIKRSVYRAIGPFFEKSKAEKLFFSKDYNMLKEPMKQTFKQVTSEYLDAVLPQIKFSTLAVFGDKDDQTPPKIANKMISKIPDCGKYIMKDCGHFCFAERPAEFNNVVREFLL